MGSGASHLNSEQKSLLVQKITSKYEKCLANKVDDEILIQVLMSDYRRVITDITPTKAAILHSPPFTTGSSKIIGKTTKFGVGLKDAAKTTTINQVKPTRRRSFDSSRVSMIKGKNTTMKSSQSETAVKLAETALDSWDSVTQQPFCEICQMAFKTAAFFERHIKYSDLHIKNIEKRKTPTIIDVPVASLKSPSTDEEVGSSGLVEPQIEGKHYRLLYTGSKIFWRTQRTIDIDIYVHIYPEILEVIAFDPVKYKEITRLYLDYAVMREMLAHLANSDFDDKIKELKQDRFFALTNEDSMRDKFMVQRVNTYILQRLQLDPGNPTMEILFAQLHSDDEMLSPLLDSPPLSTVVPVAVSRRRKTSAEEIDATINSLKIDRQLIGKHLDMASYFTSKLSVERISSAVHTFVQYLTSKKWYAELSASNQRFIRAVRRVVRMNLVKKTVEELTRRTEAQLQQTKLQQTLPSRRCIVRAREM